ncbi:MAG: tRNA (N(6)-L-threonylcarbamoyladenosine(37)-C(2))-methylthiotransferase [Candidatus Marsarchaeota archaeon]|nr:tRNA (N(6)-L-threonylcarbamoyladenosine(37)-C(2))-methylthiotransferase [Candidatus Marsarchaeota archaeon]MCL5413279.1 tRNA (N(6)-L-threonylcarbamoyladenosine(37)-C(2))-methylthiotransferase [Candidatus Marsarchaeota archaeon]
MAKAVIETYGCTLNRADSDIIEGMLKSEGMEAESKKYAESDNADYVIINTCTVKRPTEQRILDRIRKVSVGNARLVVTGCMASANRDRILAVAPRASIVTTSNVHRIADAIEELGARDRVDYEGYMRNDKLEYFSPGGSVIARIPISEGCLSNCSFCETKFARGALNSYSENLILKAIEISVGKGAKEIELTSQDVGAYGLDKKTNIGELLSGIADMEGDFRIRVGMLNPEHLPKYIDTLLMGLEDKRIYRFLHLPLQSASNKVLKDMDRRYTIEQFCSHVAEIRNKIGDISIETDMIVGYPTETDGDFQESLAFIRELRPAFTNVSRFGVRPHTKASRLKQISNMRIKNRSSEMSRIARSIQKEDLSRLVGKTESILITEQNDRSIIGRDDCYRIVALNREICNARLGERLNARIIGNTSVCLLGTAL